MSYRTVPAMTATEITPDDDARQRFRALYIGGSGDIRVQMAGGGDPITFVGVPAGILPIEVEKVFSTETTATDIIGLG